MKIALVIDKFVIGGGLEHIYQICKNMQDVEFGIFGKDGDGKDKFNNLLNVKIFNKGYDKNYVMSFGADIIHIHHLKPLLALYTINVKKIFTVHGIHLRKYDFIKGLKSKIFKFLRLNLEKYLYKKTELIVTVSNDDQEYLKRHYGINSYVIYNGIDFSPMENLINNKNISRRDLLLPFNQVLYLTVARFDFPKGYDILVGAIRELKYLNEIQDKIFIFVGDGPLLDEIKNLVIKYDLNDYVYFMGNRNNVYEIMNACDCFVLPSRWEGFPISLIEAIGCNLPIIASDASGNRTIHNMEKSVVLFKNLDISDLCRKLLSIPIPNYVNKDIFCVSNMVLKLKKIYNI
ncbi:glycosyltransferase family 4 protein [Campylobacter curvus]|uniref:Glycosyltransferase, family 1 n=1 Tax=Campylobacter curvus (strain 525.92) TaxID=360105 RepID=A7GZ31_CAMC5|nr:glycosyltransferase family 4 protein [Campylobacter curvus]EAU00067.1 glycosyltransferase, family 1 [Campylobacter curvus 525.92]